MQLSSTPGNNPKKMPATIRSAPSCTNGSAAALEKALDLEFQALPEVVNLAPLRDDYRQLLNHYQQVATAMTVLEIGAVASPTGVSEYLNPGHAFPKDPGHASSVPKNLL